MRALIALRFWSLQSSAMYTLKRESSSFFIISIVFFFCSFPSSSSLPNFILCWLLFISYTQKHTHTHSHVYKRRSVLAFTCFNNIPRKQTKYTWLCMIKNKQLVALLSVLIRIVCVLVFVFVRLCHLSWFVCVWETDRERDSSEANESERKAVSRAFRIIYDTVVAVVFVVHVKLFSLLLLFLHLIFGYKYANVCAYTHTIA